MGRARSSALSEHTLTERLADLLREAIVDGTLKPGQPLRQAELAARLGTSRIPLREALNHLAGEGLVEIHPYRGATLRELKPDELDEQLELLIALDTIVYRRAVRNLTDEGLDRLREVVGRLDPSTDGRRFLDTTREFYDVLFSLAQCPLVERVLRSLNNRFVGPTRDLFDVAEWRAAIGQTLSTLVDFMAERQTQACIDLIVATRTAATEHVERRLRERDATARRPRKRVQEV